MCIKSRHYLEMIVPINVQVIETGNVDEISKFSKSRVCFTDSEEIELDSLENASNGEEDEVCL